MNFKNDSRYKLTRTPWKKGVPSKLFLNQNFKTSNLKSKFKTHMKFFQTLNIFEISCTKTTKCVQSSEKSSNRNKALSWGNCFEPKFPNFVKSDKNKYYSHKRLLSLRPNIIKFICEISKDKMKRICFSGK